jgi:hypothetical protein
MDNYQNHPLAGATDLDSAMTKLWAFYKKYFVGLYIISIIMSVLTGLAASGIDIVSIQSTTDQKEMLEIMKGMIGPYLLVIALSLIFSVLLHAWVLEKPLGHENTLLKVLKSGLVALIPYLFVMIILMIAGSMMVAVGLVLLILPGLFAVLYIGTIALFTLPVTLVETRNPGAVLTRSFSLTHANFWQNLGWVIVVALIVIVISVVIGALVMLPFTGSLIKSVTDPAASGSMLEMTRNPFYIGLSSLTSSLVTPAFPILAFIIYFRNREEIIDVEAHPEEENKLKVEDLYPQMPEENEPKA